MVRIISLLLILILAFLSCEGRKSQNQALAESIEDFKKETIIENVEYYPDKYFEKVSDSILSNGFEAQIKTYSNMEKALSIISKLDGVVNKDYFRVLESQVDVRFNNEQVFNKIIDINFINSQSNISKLNSNLYNLNGIRINQAKSLDQNLLNLEIEYCEISSDDCRFFNLQINSKGQYDFSEI